MNKFLSSFKNKSFRYGSFSAITVVIVIAVLLVINLIFSQFDLKLDLTKDKKYTISDTSKEILDKLDEEVHIYALYKTGQEYQEFTEILDQYSMASKNVKVEYIDPYLNPTFTDKYKTNGEDISLGSYIVAKGDKFKVLSSSDLVSVDYSYDQYTGQPTQNIKSIDVEPQVTNAIKYVSMDSLPVIYYVNNHNEAEIPSNLKKKLESANYEIRELSLFNQESIPEDCSVLMMTTPNGIDYSEKESEIVKDYLAKDGRAFMIGFIAGDTPNFKSIMSAYGIVNDGKYIMEADPNYSYQNNPTYCLPEIASNETTDELLDSGSANAQLLAILAQPLKRAEVKNTTTIAPILTTSKQSYSKGEDMTSYNKEANDESGPFDIGVAITDTTYTDTNHTTKLVIFSAYSFLDDSFDYYVSGGNSSLEVSAMNWLNDTSDNVYIAPKSLESDSIVVSAATVIVIALICCLVIPFGLFITGFVVWLKRRNK